ncbi:universal stress protein [Amaricoccus sp.]|uniref:universal stress protein n=1 Tax=Amaricoccus sp. TaxID=1872485 RepID=UPI001B774891|nr:universal stress protein [Amaricoccus sp.]MBP7001862.1 universal stress protein [Amaricoccus sp.]
MFRHLVIPTDGSDLATAAVDRGVELAAQIGARITFVTVIEHFHLIAYSPAQIAESVEAYNADTAKRAAEILAGAEAKARAAGVEASSLVRRSDHPYVEISAAADEVGADLIVISSHGRRGVTAMVLGSQTSKLLSTTTRPVLVIR